MPEALMDELQRELLEMRKKGMETGEIARKLNLSTDTVIWLITHLDTGKTERGLTSDMLIDWANIGTSPVRVSLLGRMLADLVQEEISADQVHGVIGLAVNGIPLAQEVARTLEKPCVVAETSDEVDFYSPFFDMKGRKVIIIDHVINTGRTLRKVVKDLENMETTPLGIFVFVDKRSWKSNKKDIEGIRTHSLVQAVKT